MLRTRVITAVVILLLTVGMLFFAWPSVWSLFVLAVALASCWEWSRLCGLGRTGQAIFLVLSGAFGGALWMTYMRADEATFRELTVAAFVIAAVFWIAVAPPWLRFKWRPAPLLAALAGWIVIWPTWFAFVALREIGPWVFLAVAAIVWIADIAAYFAGRKFGKRKLAPAISPGKSWEGVYGVILAVIAHVASSPIGDLFRPALGIPAIIAMMLLAAISVVGDLLESWMKRGAGRKDSSRLLPGHGGVLDRIDALTSMLPLATLAILIARA